MNRTFCWVRVLTLCGWIHVWWRLVADLDPGGSLLMSHLHNRLYEQQTPVKFVNWDRRQLVGLLVSRTSCSRFLYIINTQDKSSSSEHLQNTFKLQFTLQVIIKLTLNIVTCFKCSEIRSHNDIITDIVGYSWGQKTLLLNDIFILTVNKQWDVL